jgi:hypothetical protein
MPSLEALPFLPDPRRRGEIHFELAKGLPYTRRLAVILVLLAIGFLLQVTVDLFVGAAFLLAATLLAVVRGYSNVPQTTAGGEWRVASREQFDSVLRIASKSREWDQSLLDVTCPTGIVGLVAASVLVTIPVAGLWNNGNEWLAMAIAVDSAVLFLPHWVTGVRRILTNAPLTVKVELLREIIDAWERLRLEGETIHPQMQVARASDGEMPTDAKLVFRFDKLGDAFLGLQVQVTLNNVQGKDYPYLYCVLVARPSLGLLAMPASKYGAPAGIVVEPSRKKPEGLDLVVVRQETTKTEGYHTSSAAALGIFRYALGLCRGVASASSPG